MATASLGKALKCSLWNVRKIRSHSSNGMSMITSWTVVLVATGLVLGHLIWRRYIPKNSHTPAPKPALFPLGTSSRRGHPPPPLSTHLLCYIATASLLSTQRDGPLRGCGSLDLSQARNLSVSFKCTQSHWVPVESQYCILQCFVFHKENQSHCWCVKSQVVKHPL